MSEWYSNCGVFYFRLTDRMERRLRAFAREEKGDLVSSLGWMAIMALLLVMIKGIVDGKLTGYVNNIFSYLDQVFN